MELHKNNLLKYDEDDDVDADDNIFKILSYKVY